MVVKREKFFKEECARQEGHFRPLTYQVDILPNNAVPSDIEGCELMRVCRYLNETIFTDTSGITLSFIVITACLISKNL